MRAKDPAVPKCDSSENSINKHHNYIQRADESHEIVAGVVSMLVDRQQTRNVKDLEKNGQAKNRSSDDLMPSTFQGYLIDVKEGAIVVLKPLLVVKEVLIHFVQKVVC